MQEPTTGTAAELSAPSVPLTQEGARLWLAPLLALSSVTAALAVYLVLAGPSLIPEGVPSFGAAFTGAMLAIAACCAFAVRCVARLDPSGASRRPLFDTAGAVRVFDRFTILGLFAGCALILALFLLRPATFSRAAAEDFVIEMLSALLCLAAGAILAACGALALKRASARRLEAALLIGGGATAALIGLEEISWFQRQLSIATPAAFGANLQNELNLHNFATNAIENAYYFASFAFFCVLPYVAARTRLTSIPALRDGAARLVPGIGPFVAIAISCGYNYDMWIGFPTQLAFWLGVFVTLDLALTATARQTRFVLWTCLALLVISQLAFLLRGDLQRDRWDVTEYREYLIAVAVFAYACEQVIGRTLGRGRRMTRRIA